MRNQFIHNITTVDQTSSSNLDGNNWGGGGGNVGSRDVRGSSSNVRGSRGDVRGSRSDVRGSWRDVRSRSRDVRGGDAVVDSVVVLRTGGSYNGSWGRNQRGAHYQGLGR